MSTQHDERRAARRRGQRGRRVDEVTGRARGRVPRHRVAADESTTTPTTDTTSRDDTVAAVAEETAEDEEFDPVAELRAEAALRARRLVRGALVRRLREQGQDQPRDPDHEPRHGGVHLPGRGADRKRSRSRTASASRCRTRFSRLHPGPDGADAESYARAQHAGRHRLRRRHRRPAGAAVPRRGAQVALPRVEPSRPPRAGRTPKRRRWQVVVELDFEVGDSVTVTDGAVRLAAGHDQRDQRRPAEAQGAGLDLRPGDPGRAELQPGRPRSEIRHATAPQQEDDDASEEESSSRPSRFS